MARDVSPLIKINVEFGRALSHHIGDDSYSSIHPLYKSLVIFGLVDSLRGQRIVTRESLVFGQQVNNIGGVARKLAPDEVKEGSTRHTLMELLVLVRPLDHQISPELTQLLGAGESNLKLLLETGDIVGEGIIAVEIGLYDLRFADFVHVHACVVGELVPVVIYGWEVNIVDFPHMPTISGIIHENSLEFAGVGPGCKDGAGYHLRNCIEYRIISGFQRGIRHTDKVLRVVDGGNVRLAGDLLLNRIQRCRNLIKAHFIHGCHLNIFLSLFSRSG